MYSMRQMQGRYLSEEYITHKLAARIALHGLSLAITSEVIGSTALVAGGSARVSTVSATEAAVESSTRSTHTTTSRLDCGSRAVAL